MPSAPRARPHRRDHCRDHCGDHRGGYGAVAFATTSVTSSREQRPFEYVWIAARSSATISSADASSRRRTTSTTPPSSKGSSSGPGHYVAPSVTIVSTSPVSRVPASFAW